MKIYEIIDEENKLSVGYLLYFEKEKSFVIELQNYLDEWNAPLLFANTVKAGKFTIGREFSRLWVNERVIPAGRQNIDLILANAQLKEYDEAALLDKSSARCSQDSMYINKVDVLPDYIIKRMETNLEECVPCENHSLLCFFNDKTVKKIDLLKLNKTADITKITSNEKVFKSAHIAAGGYFVTFNDSIDIDAKELYENGDKIPLSLEDFFAFVKMNVLDSSECCDVLECSRQNLTNYLSKDLLVPLKPDVKGNLYTKGNVYRLL